MKATKKQKRPSNNSKGAKQDASKAEGEAEVVDLPVKKAKQSNSSTRKADKKDKGDDNGDAQSKEDKHQQLQIQLSVACH